MTPPPEQPPADEGNVVTDVAEEAANTAKDEATSETKRGIRDAVRKGIGGLFGR